MRKAALMLIAATVALLLGSQPSRAYGDGAWCAVFTLAPGGAAERCEYRDFESCRLDIVAGNRGFCRQNGYAMSPVREPRKPGKRGHR